MKLVTACTLDCPDSCSLLVDVEDGRVIEIAGNPVHPFTAGFTCAKIKRFARRLEHPERITSPLLRVGAGWQAVSWDNALDLCAEKIQKYRREPLSILHIQGGADKGVLAHAPRLFFGRLGATNAGGSLCNIAGTSACIADFGGRLHNDCADLAQARKIVNWGRDSLRSSVHMAALISRARQQGAQVITISPGGDSSQSLSDIILTIRPGADRFLAAAVIRLLIERDLIRQDILDHAVGWDTLRECVLRKSLAEYSSACGVALADIERLFEFYSQDGPAASVLGWGLQRHPYGGENVRYIDALAFLSGQIGRSGGGSYFALSSNQNYSLHWADDMNKASERVLKPTVGRDILEAKDPPIRMLWVDGINVVNQAPDTQAIISAFAATEFKVVVDAFMNDTTERADLILPCALMLEKEDLVGSTLHHVVNYVRPVAPLPGEARSDHWILSELGKRLDPPVLLPEAEACLRMSLDSPFLGISLEELRQAGFVRANRPAIAYEGLYFDHADGRYRFPSELHDEPAPPPGYPLRLLSLVRREFIHSQILPEEHVSPPTVWISPGIPAWDTLDRSRDVYLASPLGRLRVMVESDPALPPGVVLYRRGDWMQRGGGINQLIEAGVTDLGGGAPYYQQYVRLEN